VPCDTHRHWQEGFEAGRKAERENWLRELEAIDHNSYDTKDFTRRVCDLIAEEKQMLK